MADADLAAAPLESRSELAAAAAATEALIPTRSPPATGAWTPTDALAATDALAPTDAQLPGPLRLTRAMPGTRVETPWAFRREIRGYAAVHSGPSYPGG